MRIFLISFLILFGCASTNDVTKKVGNDKRVFFATSKKEGYEFMKMQELTLRRIDSVREPTGTVYLFFYKDQQK